MGQTQSSTNVKRGLHPTFPNQTKLNQLLIISCYVHPHRNLYLLEALHQLTNKNAVEFVKNQESLGFYNWLFLVPKPNNKWRLTLDLKNLNKFLKENGNTRNDPDLPTDRGVCHIYRFQGCLLSRPPTSRMPCILVYPYKTNQENIFDFMHRAKHSNHYHLVCPQLPWSSL